MAMDNLYIPKTDKERRQKEIACILSMGRGTVPYFRSFGVMVDIDAAMPAEKQRAFALASQEIETRVPAVRVASGYVRADINGHARIYLKIIDK